MQHRTSLPGAGVKGVRNGGQQDRIGRLAEHGGRLRGGGTDRRKDLFQGMAAEGYGIYTMRRSIRKGHRRKEGKIHGEGKILPVNTLEDKI